MHEYFSLLLSRHEDLNPEHLFSHYSAPLFSRIEREVVHSPIVLRPDVVETSVVSKSPPLHVDTHPPLISLHHLDVPHLLHVARVAASSCSAEVSVR